MRQLLLDVFRMLSADKSGEYFSKQAPPLHTVDRRQTFLSSE